MSVFDNMCSRMVCIRLLDFMKTMPNRRPKSVAGTT